MTTHWLTGAPVGRGPMPGRAPPTDESGLQPLAAVVQRLGVLLSAGVAPTSGWSYLAEFAEPSVHARVSTIAGAAQSGAPIAEAILAAADLSGDERGAWCGLAAAWFVATESGAPLAATLATFADSLRSLAQNHRDVQTALAGPVATARMVMILPVVGVLFGLALGFNTVGVLFGTPIGVGCLVIGIGLMVLARWWNRHLIQSARPVDLTPGLELDLLAIAVSGGASFSRAESTVAVAQKRFGTDIATASTRVPAVVPGKNAISGADGNSGPGESAPKSKAVRTILDLSSRAGVPAAVLLRSEAAEQRRSARSDAERRAATLSVTLMLPLGLCILPAFMLLGVAPLLIAVISSTVDTFN